jgi:hypothetical protein
MIRANLWFTCAAMHDPVTPIIVKPSVLGWKAKKREVELTIERAFTGEELVLRMKGWVTADVKQVIETIKPCGYLKVLDEQDLVVEIESGEDYEQLANSLREKFGDQIFLERLYDQLITWIDVCLQIKLIPDNEGSQGHIEPICN